MLILQFQVFEADPEHLDLEEVNAFIFSFLRRKLSNSVIDACAPGLETFRHCVNGKLSRELQMIVIEYLHPLGERVDPQPLGLLLPEDWRNLLVSATPWLWDLDLSKSFQCQAAEWDWEQLVRMLAQADAFEPGGCMQGACAVGVEESEEHLEYVGRDEAPR